MLPYVVLLFSNCREVARIVLKTPVQYCIKKPKNPCPRIVNYLPYSVCHFLFSSSSAYIRMCTHAHSLSSLPLCCSSSWHHFTSESQLLPAHLIFFPQSSLPSFFPSSLFLFFFLSLPCCFIDTYILA